ncbi:hypothetical protein GCM10018980_10940 [Streptomyces capoamus]|uniref:Uncharacterized protein n=1 Tax=Streptomyces capoamus TaxID=68183 RepID=A0A919C3G1_9ACTN|nr:hypothetical protein GCM10018980_10940 [Streptomyces capoamus]
MARITAPARIVTNAPVRVWNPTAPTARPPAVRTRTGITRFSIRIRSRISRRRNCRYRTFLTSLPSGIGSTYEPERWTWRTAYSPCSSFSNLTPYDSSRCTIAKPRVAVWRTVDWSTMPSLARVISAT